MNTPTIHSTLASIFQVVDVELRDVKVGPGEYDVSETITVTFASKEAARALGKAMHGMVPGQAEDLAMALMDASRQWQQGGALHALHPAAAEAATA